MRHGITVGSILLIAFLAYIATNSFYVVTEMQQTILLQFGKPIKQTRDPGIYLKLPYIQNVVTYDKRLLDLDNPVQEVITSDRKRLLVDTVGRYRIIDPLLYLQSLRTTRAANSRLSTLVNSSLKRVMGTATFADIVRNDRSNLMGQINGHVNNDSKNFGVEMVDVKIRRADLPEANSEAIYSRMQTERQQEAAEIRAKGQEELRRIKSDADRQSVVIQAIAEQEAQQIRGKGDGTRTKIYADAYNQDPEFFSFYRSMEAYKKGLLGNNTTYLLSPDSEFFKYFKSYKKQQAPASLTQ